MTSIISRWAWGMGLTSAVIAGVAGCAGSVPNPMAADVSGPPLQVYSAGSLREALTTIASEYTARTGQKIVLTFGASGLLRERIEKGEPAQVFTSADTGHPQRLAATGQWHQPMVFVRNQLCALTSDALDVTPESLLATLLRGDVRVGTSTPVADPSGDYAWALFRKADALLPGAFARLDAKALKLTGGPESPQPPAGRGAYAWLMAQGRADVFLVYCTNAIAAQRELPRLKVVQVPPDLQVGAAYGMAVRTGAHPSAKAFSQALLAAPAQTVFRRFGFGAP